MLHPSFPAATCTGGKEWQDCGTACPLTCDNYENPQTICTLECVSDCFCPEGKVDVNGVCVNPSACPGGFDITFVFVVLAHFSLLTLRDRSQSVLI